MNTWNYEYWAEDINFSKIKIWFIGFKDIIIVHGMARRNTKNKNVRANNQGVESNTLINTNKVHIIKSSYQTLDEIFNLPFWVQVQRTTEQ